MKNNGINIKKYLRHYSGILLLAGVLTGCATIDPRNIEVELKETKPYATITSYSSALHQLGVMTEIYDTPELKMQCNPIGDNTGSAAATGGEIPRDITEMMKSSLNTIGGKIVFIPYDPSFIQNQMVTGYSNFAYKVIPDVVLTGGITEFDRGLETRSKNTDVNIANDINGLPGWLPSKYSELRYSGAEKAGLARITLDFNLLDFQTMTGISKINTTNSMEVRKILSEREVGISLFGQSFGGKGSIKKVQGRHAAVRLLVQLSMIQMTGKHLMLPYWRLLGQDARPDPVVMNQIDNYYYNMTEMGLVASLQEWLYLYGYDLELTAQLDKQTADAIKAVCPWFDRTKGIDLKTFRHIYLNIPVTIQAKSRRDKFNSNY